MSATLTDLWFFGLCFPVVLVTALRPRWTFYVSSLGKPERLTGREGGIRFTRLCAAFAAIGLLIAIGEIVARHVDL